MKLLAVETATEACSAALCCDGVIQERFEVAPRQHGKLLLGMLESLLDEAGISVSQLDALAFGRGPGSFTGLRIAAGVIQGVALAADLPVVPVSTLAALAQNALTDKLYEYAFVALDARMNEIYWGVYTLNERRCAKPVDKEQVAPAEAIVFSEQGTGIGIGNGWQVYPSELKSCLGNRILKIEASRHPRAKEIAYLGVDAFKHGQAVAPELALPVYLRDEVAKKKVKFPR